MTYTNPSITTVIGSSAKGKTSRVIVPQILSAIEQDHSFVVCDPKNQILEYIGHKLSQKDYKVIILNLRDPEKSMSWNPLIPPYKIFINGNKQKAYSYLADIAKNIYSSLGGNQKDFWDSSACDFFVALVSSIFNKAREEQINLKTILNMTVIGEERYATSNFLKAYFDLEDSNSYPFLTSHSVVNAPSDTKGGILSTFKNSLQRLTSNDKYESILCFNDFNLEDCIQKKVAIILNYEDENPTNAEIITIFIDMLYKYLVDRRTKDKQLFTFSFFLDDFLSLPKLNSFDQMIMASGSRNISLSIVINNKSLFEKYYGKESINALLSNSNFIVYFKGNDIDTNDYIMKLCAQKGFFWDETALKFPLVISDTSVFSLSTPHAQVNSFCTYSPINKHANEKIEIFSIKEYVVKEKKRKMYENIGDINSDNKIEPEQAPGNPFFTSNEDISDLIANIDERIQKLTAEENNPD